MKFVVNLQVVVNVDVPESEAHRADVRFETRRKAVAHVLAHKLEGNTAPGCAIESMTYLGVARLDPPEDDPA